MKIILFSGKKLAGKNYLSQAVAKKVGELGCFSYSLEYSRKLKEMLGDLFGMTYEQVNRFKTFDAKLLIQTDSKTQVTFPLPRFIRSGLQWLGTDVVRQVDELFWTKYLYDQIQTFIFQDNTLVSITDWRFPNEYTYLRDHLPPTEEMYSIRVIAEGEVDNTDPTTSHSSENSLSDWKFNLTLYNIRGDKKNLKQNVDAVMKLLDIKKIGT